MEALAIIRVKYRATKDGEIIPYEAMLFDWDPYRLSNGRASHNKTTYFPQDIPQAEIDAEPFPEYGEGKSEAEGRGDGGEPEGRDYGGEAKRRAVKAVRDLVMCTPSLDWFVTLTFSPDNVDRTDYKAIIKRMNNWLDNRVRRQGLAYVLVPELHADGRSIHFHGFMNDALSMVFSGIVQKGRHVYNLREWEYGFTNCKRIKGDSTRAKTLAYMLKYITKGEGKIGGRYYLHGGSLGAPLVKIGTIPWGALDGEGIAVGIGKHVKVSRDELTVYGLTTGMKTVWAQTARNEGANESGIP